MVYPTVAEQEAMVKWVPGTVIGVDFEAGNAQGLGIDLAHEREQDVKFYGYACRHAFFYHEEKRQYMISKDVQKGDHVRVALNPIGILMDVQKVE